MSPDKAHAVWASQLYNQLGLSPLENVGQGEKKCGACALFAFNPDFTTKHFYIGFRDGQT
ncbi:hypothetical protein JCM15548_1557 [Geofilum rubicundum JCM 15548]|uniref:Uncharacterized protein n=1 Tax=Geofilum rubicundum JCM 15548 TaxID=1236989 RepID=A0A0E9LUD3_9BACT|nr:hypothetical protein JCM15548_1557 [Geofilum rubicundum JCM 15548]